MKRTTWPAAIAALALITAACTSATTTTASPGTTGAPTTVAPGTTGASGTTAAPSTTAAPFTGTPVKACFITDLAGVDDRSFNAAGWQGVNDAVAAGYVQPDPQLLESDSRDDYQPNIDQCVTAGAEHIVTNGFELAEATKTNAEAHPDVTFTIIDNAYDPDIPNVRELVYQTDEGAFAAGYLAAGVSQSGILGTYGGVNIPTVTIFMDGFARGARYYNEQKGTNVQVLGWDPDNPEGGLMTGTFDPGKPEVRAACESLLDEGADLILPVGGAINNPCGTAILERGIDAGMIGVDTDAYFAMPENLQSLWLVTVLKGISVQVTNSLRDDAEGDWTPGGVVGNVANGSIGLSEYHDWADRVPAELDAEVKALLASIADGTFDAATYTVG